MRKNLNYNNFNWFILKKSKYAIGRLRVNGHAEIWLRSGRYPVVRIIPAIGKVLVDVSKVPGKRELTLLGMSRGELLKK